MDWNDCLKRRIAKPVREDKSLIASTRTVASILTASAKALLPDHHLAKIVLLYDVLREYLKCVALEKGYKIYNHECYTYFLKEVMAMSREGDLFDEMRKIRNSITYYGKNVSPEEAEDVIKKLELLIRRFRA